VVCRTVHTPRADGRGARQVDMWELGRDVQSLQDRAQVHASPIDIWWER